MTTHCLSTSPVSQSNLCYSVRDSNEFWIILKQIRANKMSYKRRVSISPSAWKDHFLKLLNPAPSNVKDEVREQV